MNDETILDLFSSRSKLCFLAGAGISIDEPSCLPAGNRFSEAALRKVVPLEEQRNILTLMDPERESTRALGDFLRFEELIELIQQDMDPDLCLLDVFKFCNRPNLAHLFLAHMLLRGHKVMTTNFDSLIAYALIYLGVDADSVFPVIDRDEWEAEPLHQERFSIYKLHGSLFHVRNQRDCRETVQATLARISENKDQFFCLEEWKRIVVERLLRNYDLVVVGYSGLDDFDVMPTLWSIPSEKRLIWIEHGKDLDLAQAIVENGSEFGTPETQSSRRLLQNLKRFVALGVRPAEKIIYIRVNTRKLMEGLWKKFLQVDLPILKASTEVPALDLTHLDPNYAQKWILAGQIYHDRQDNARSFSCYERGLQEARDKGATVCQLHCLIGLAHSLLKMGRNEEALPVLQEVIDLADRVGDKRFKAMALNEVSMDKLNRGFVDEAIRTLREAYADVGDETLVRWRARTLNNLALAYVKKREFIEARRHFEEAITLNERLGDLRAQSTNLANLALFYGEKGDLELALETYDKVLSLSEQLGDISKKALALGQKGLIYVGKGDFRRALPLYNEALAAVRQIDMPYQEVTLLLNMILLHHRMRDKDEGLRRSNEALDVLESLDKPEIEATILHLKGNFLHNKRWFNEAEEAFRKCIDVHGRLDQPGRLSNALSDFAFTLHDMKRPREAIDMIRRARDLAEQAGDMPALMHANQVEKIIRLGL
jgi:tetratricopeptide (TPR) repeat protein